MISDPRATKIFTLSLHDALPVCLMKDGRVRRIELQRIDGEPASASTALGEALRAAGFVDGYRGFVLRG